MVCRVCPVCPDPPEETDTLERREIEETRDLLDLVDPMERSEWLATPESGLSERKEIPEIGVWRVHPDRHAPLRLDSHPAPLPARPERLE